MYVEFVISQFESLRSLISQPGARSASTRSSSTPSRDASTRPPPRPRSFLRSGVGAAARDGRPRRQRKAGARGSRSEHV